MSEEIEEARPSAVIMEFRSRRNSQQPLSNMQTRLEFFEEKYGREKAGSSAEISASIAERDSLRVLQLLDERRHLSLRAARAAEFSGGIAANECIREAEAREEQ